MGLKRLENILAISFACDANSVAVGDLVKIVSNNKVAVVTEPTDKIIGRVCVYLKDATSCTVATKFRNCLYDVVAGENLSVGPFVYGGENKAYQYVSGTRCTVTGSKAGTFAITADTNDELKLKYRNGSTETIELTAGASRTTAQIAADINTADIGIVASVSADDKLVLTGSELYASIEVVSSSSLSALGLTAGVYWGTFPSHDYSQIDGMVIKSGNTGAAVTVLEY